MNEMSTVTTFGAKGPLIAIGGAEDKSSRADILRRVLHMSPKVAPVVGVITTASSIPGHVYNSYLTTFSALGTTEVLDVRIRDRNDAASEENVAMIQRSDIIFLTGGDQMRLTNILGATPAMAAIRARHADGAVIAGTSAGAACMPHTMVYSGSAGSSLRKGAVKMAAGFGLVGGVIIDTHFLERGRFSRLLEVGATNPEYIGLGIGEDSAVLFEKDVIRAFGSGHTIVIDSSQVTGSNVFDLEEGEAVSVHNVIMHVLVDGYGYNLTDRRVLGPDDLGAKNLEHRIENS